MAVTAHVRPGRRLSQLCIPAVDIDRCRRMLLNHRPATKPDRAPQQADPSHAPLNRSCRPVPRSYAALCCVRSISSEADCYDQRRIRLW